MAQSFQPAEGFSIVFQCEHVLSATSEVVEGILWQDFGCANLDVVKTHNLAIHDDRDLALKKMLVGISRF